MARAPRCASHDSERRGSSPRVSARATMGTRAGLRYRGTWTWFASPCTVRRPVPGVMRIALRRLLCAVSWHMVRLSMKGGCDDDLSFPPSRIVTGLIEGEVAACEGGQLCKVRPDASDRSQAADKQRAVRRLLLSSPRPLTPGPVLSTPHPLSPGPAPTHPQGVIRPGRDVVVPGLQAGGLDEHTFANLRPLPEQAERPTLLAFSGSFGKERSGPHAEAANVRLLVKRLFEFERGARPLETACRGWTPLREGGAGDQACVSPTGRAGEFCPVANHV